MLQLQEEQWRALRRLARALIQANLHGLLDRIEAEAPTLCGNAMRIVNVHSQLLSEPSRIESLQASISNKLLRAQPLPFKFEAYETDRLDGLHQAVATALREGFAPELQVPLSAEQRHALHDALSAQGVKMNKD